MLYFVKNNCDVSIDVNLEKKLVNIKRREIKDESDR